MPDQGSVVQVNVSGGGVPKLPVLEAQVGELGLAGDRHYDERNHGGRGRAVSLFAIELIEALAAEGHPITPGGTGENVTTRGIDWEAIVPGARLRLGPDCLLEVTSHTAPCFKIEGNFLDRDFSRISQKAHPGWSRAYARVLVPGRIRPGDAIELIPAPGPE